MSAGLRPSLKLVLLSSRKQSAVREVAYHKDAEIHALQVMQDPMFRAWGSASGPCFLSVQNTLDATGTGAVLQRNLMARLFSLDYPKKQLVHFFFEFKATDCRYNTVQSMPSTLLAEIDHRCAKTQSMFTQPIMDIEDQFNMLQAILSSPKCPKTT